MSKDFYVIPSKSGDVPHQVRLVDGSWRCDHIRQARERSGSAVLPSSRTGVYDRRWFKAFRLKDDQPVAILMLVGTPGPITVYDGMGSVLVAWDDASSVIRTEHDGDELIEVAHSSSVEVAYFGWLVARRQTDIRVWL